MATAKKTTTKKAPKKVAEVVVETPVETPVETVEVKAASKFIEGKFIEGQPILSAVTDGKYYTVRAANGNTYKLLEAEYNAL